MYEGGISKGQPYDGEDLKRMEGEIGGECLGFGGAAVLFHGEARGRRTSFLVIDDRGTLSERWEWIGEQERCSHSDRSG